MPGAKMNRDFEIRQLLRAYRSGLMSEAAFDEEMTRMEHDSGEPGSPPAPGGFEVGGRVFRSEREAVLTFLDELHATQMDSALAFAKWAAICSTPGLRTGLVIAAERTAYHARIIQRRVHELGGELRSTATPHGGRLVQLLADGTISDLEKLATLASFFQEPQQAVAPLLAFADAIKRDIETKQALSLIAEDELSTVTWLNQICAMLANTQSQLSTNAGGEQPDPRAQPEPGSERAPQ